MQWGIVAHLSEESAYGKMSSQVCLRYLPGLNLVTRPACSRCFRYFPMFCSATCPTEAALHRSAQQQHPTLMLSIPLKPCMLLNTSVQAPSRHSLLSGALTLLYACAEHNDAVLDSLVSSQGRSRSMSGGQVTADDSRFACLHWCVQAGMAALPQQPQQSSLQAVWPSDLPPPSQTNHPTCAASLATLQRAGQQYLAKGAPHVMGTSRSWLLALEVLVRCVPCGSAVEA